MSKNKFHQFNLNAVFGVMSMSVRNNMLESVEPFVIIVIDAPSMSLQVSDS